MTFVPVRPPYLLRRYYSSFVWRMPDEDRVAYLTFDDGPIPEVTEFVLDTLKEHQIKATFFCIGKNVRANPSIYSRILEEGHSVGNHTENHINGWNVNTRQYVTDALSAADVIKSELFRPPYGRIRKQQADMLQHRYKIVMWDVLSYDFDAAVSPEQCFNNVVRNVRPGSIIVFHDSIKARKNMEYSLPLAITKLKSEGYRFAALQ